MVRLILLIALFGVTPWTLSNASPFSPKQSTIDQQRSIYRQAKLAIEIGDRVNYQNLRQQILSYPLLPYLDYQEIRQQLKQLPYQKVDNFLEQHQKTYLGKLLLRRWLNLLANRNYWHEYRSYYLPILDSDRHECWYLWSRYKTGDQQALAETERLWNVAKSQPGDCDPLFQQWHKAGFLTVNLVWERHRKALLRGKKRLSRYLRKFMPESTQQKALLFYRTLLRPERLANLKTYQVQDLYFRDIVFNGLKRFAHSKPMQALKLWIHYRGVHHFDEAQEQSFFFELSKEFAYLGDEKALASKLVKLNNQQKTVVIETIIRTLLHQQNWQGVINWMAYLPKKELLTDRWRYWQARAKQALALPKDNYQKTYEELAQLRSFYGFLSADHLQQEYDLQHNPSEIPPAIFQQLRQNPSMARARELFYFKELHHARQEWANATANLSTQEHQAAAKIAYEWGWYRKSIESMAAAETWDDLHIRFPIAHESIVRQQAQASRLPATLIFAIARQESAWETDAQSSAGAMGLMQLLPRTAKYTAAKAGVYHKRSELLKPEHNIKLGTRYMSELLAQYKNNRVPAIAAYNAGPNQVNRWLEKSDNRLPNDIWIEAIPFKETRKYVQNVLAYTVVYAYRMGEKMSLLTNKEAQSLL